MISKILFIMSILSQKHIAVTSAAVTGKIDMPGWKPPSADSKLETEMQLA